MTEVRPPKVRGLLTNSIALLAGTNISALLGFLFWMLCARTVSASAIGMANTVISAMTLGAIVSVAGFMPLLTRLLPGAGAEERSGLCSTAFVVSAVVSGVAGLAGVWLLPDRVHAAVGTAWLMPLLAVGTAATALLFVVGAALLGIRRAELSLLGGVVGSLLRLVAVPLMLFLGIIVANSAASAAHTILTAWVASLLVSFGVCAWLLARATPGFRFRPGWIWLSRLRGPVKWDHLATLAVRSPTFVVPILAAAIFPPAEVGYMAMAALISSVYFAVASAVSNSLLAHCADGLERLGKEAFRALRLIGALLVGPVVITCLLAHHVLSIFGADYARYSALLVLLLLCTLPDALVNVAVAVLRVQRRLVGVAAITVTGAAITIGGSWLLMPHLGIMGAGWSALASQLIVATTSAVVVRRSFVSARGSADDGQDVSPADVEPTPAGGGERPRGLRILHATDSFLPNVGGLELSTAALARAQVSRGHVVAVATAQHPNAPDQENMDGAEVHRLPMAMAHVPGAYVDPTHLYFPPVADPLFARAFADLVSRFQPDVIHVRGWVLYSVLGAARRAGVPVVASAHDHSHVCATKIMLYHGQSLCSGPAFTKCLGCAHSHYGLKGIPLAAGLHQVGSRRHRDVAQWTATSSALAARGTAPRPIDHSPVTVIPTFIDDDLLSLASDERTGQRPEFVPATGPYLFYAGVLGSFKGVDVLLDAHARLRADGIDVPLVLAGLPRPDFRVADRPGVVVVTNVPPPEVVAGWRHAAVGIVPSLVPEGFGRVAVECLAASTPCIVSALGGLLDVVADGVEGLHVPPGDAAALADAIRRLLEDEGLRLRLGAAGPAKAARFTLSQVMPRLDEVYLRVVNDASAGQVSSRKSLSLSRLRQPIGSKGA
jgi:glycosyltransferase involved in cell wall biosynthesis/O-antigen/teichoic acid export membrane protein